MMSTAAAALTVDRLLQTGLLAVEETAVSRNVTQPLRPSLASVKEARDFTGTTLRCWGMVELLDDLGVVVSELVTNALRHGLRLAPGDGPLAWQQLPEGWDARWPVQLSLLRIGPHVMCSVNDPSTEVPVRRTPDCVAETGRGLNLVDALSRAWGWIDLAREGRAGKAVWALFSAACEAPVDVSDGVWCARREY